MKILIADDDEAKRDEIAAFIGECGVRREDILVASSMAEFAARLNDGVAICVIDLRLPAYDGGSVEHNGLGVLQVLESRDRRSVKRLAISSYPEDFESTRDEFERRGCLLLDFHSKQVWQGAVKQMIVEAQALERLDFLIFCALSNEMSAYLSLQGISVTQLHKAGGTRLEFSVAGRRGAVIALPRMGLVDAAAVAGAQMEALRPRVVGMSGVCAGFLGRAELGQLLVSEMSYEYQSGKWTREGFAQEPYQVSVSERARTLVHSMLGDSNLLAELERGWRGNRPAVMSPPKLASFTSGSAVIADEERMQGVGASHRRVAGLDMEIYAIQRAASIARCKPETFCVKVVVDLANSRKDDTLHPYGCYVSAHFMIKVLEKYFIDGC